jgi:hypothetical protein
VDVLSAFARRLFFLGSRGRLIHLLKKAASAEECEGLLAATIAGMVAIVGDADPMEPFQRVRIGVTDAVGAHPDQEVVSIREDVAGPTDHAVVRRVVPGAVVPLAS